LLFEVRGEGVAGIGQVGLDALQGTVSLFDGRLAIATEDIPIWYSLIEGLVQVLDV
jgi:hypothetical protein